MRLMMAPGWGLTVAVMVTMPLVEPWAALILGDRTGVSYSTLNGIVSHGVFSMSSPTSLA